MLASIFYKEYLKIRRAWLIIASCNLLLLAKIFIDTRQLFLQDHAEIVWYRVMHLGQMNYEMFQYAPLLTGLSLSCFQFLPEMTGERLRLSLHLPFSPHRLILAHVITGLAAVALIIGIDLVALTAIESTYFPVESVHTALFTVLPWCAAGLSAYLGGTLGLLEPNIKRRLFNLAIAAGVTGLFLHHAAPAAYAKALPLLLAFMLLLAPAVLLPGYHFRLRRVS